MQFIDLLGQPVSVGDKLLVKGHFSMSLDTVSTVTRINKKSITVEVPTRKLLRRGEYCYVSHTWITPNEYTTVMQSMPRQASECLKLSEEQIDKINYVANQNLNNFLVSDPASHIPEKLTAHSYNLFFRQPIYFKNVTTSELTQKNILIKLLKK